MLIRSLARNLALQIFGELLCYSVLRKGKSATSPLFGGPEVFCLLHLIKQNYLPKTFLITLDDVGIFLPVFPSRINLKLHHISVTPKMVKMVITNLGLPNAPGPDGISVVVLKYFEPKLPDVLANLFNKCPNESCFQDCWRV